METVVVSAHKRKKHAGKREEDLKDLPHRKPVYATLKKNFWNSLDRDTVSFQMRFIKGWNSIRHCLKLGNTTRPCM
jgi:hypothetical protein